MTNKLLSTTLLSLAFAMHSGERRAQQPQAQQPGQTQSQPRTQGGSNTNSQSQTNQRTSTPGQSSATASTMTSRSFVEKVAEDSRMEIELARMASSRAQSPQVKSYADQLVRDHTKAMSDLQKYASKHNITISNTASTSNNTASPSASNRSNTDTSTGTNNTTSDNNRSNTAGGNNSSSAANNRSNTTGQSTNQSANNGRSGENSRPDAMASADNPHMRELNSKSGAEFDQAYVKLMVADHEKAVTMFEQQRDAKDNDAELRSFVNSTLPTLRNHLTKARDLEKTVMNTNTNTKTNSNTNSTQPANGNNSRTNPSSNTTPSPTTPQR